VSKLVRPIFQGFSLRRLTSPSSLLTLISVRARGVRLANLTHTLDISGVAYSVELKLLVSHFDSLPCYNLLYHRKIHLSNKKAPTFLTGPTYSQFLFGF
jgi:hypothetical protein